MTKLCQELHRYIELLWGTMPWLCELPKSHCLFGVGLPRVSVTGHL